MTRAGFTSGALLLLCCTQITLPGEARSSTGARSVCEVTGDDGAPLRLTLREIAWSGWADHCAQLAHYLSARPGPSAPRRHFSPAERARLLLELPTFEQAECSALEAATPGGVPGAACVLSPRRIVRRVKVRGRLPFAILGDDLRRRIFLRPGTPIDDASKTLARQQQRLQTFFENEGYFDTTVTLGTRPVPGAEPGRGLELGVQVQAGRPAHLREVILDGVLPVEVSMPEVQRLFTHRVLGLWRERFIPRRVGDDAEKLVTMLQERGYPEARVKARWAIDASAHAADLTLDLDPGPRVVVRILGNRVVRNQDLEALITFREVGAADSVEAEISAEAMRKAYQERGYAEASVRTRLSSPEEGTLWHGFEVSEGSRTAVGEVLFEGNTVFSAKALLREAQLKIGPPGLFGRSRLVDEVLAADRRAIVLAYRQRGYAATTVTSRTEHLPSGLLRLIHSIDEGPRRWVEKMIMAGLPPEVDAVELVSALTLRSGTPYVHAALAGDRRTIHAFLARAGYARGEVKRDLERPPREVGGPATLHYRIRPGPRSHFGGVLVSGNFRTREGLLEERLSLEPGDDLDLMVLGRSRRALLELGPFSTVDLEPLGIWRDDGQTWLSVRVKERSATTLDLVLAASSDDGFSIGTDLRDRNLLGRAVRLDARLRAGWIFRLIDPRLKVGSADTADLLLSAPEPFGLPFDLNLTGFYRFREKPDFDERRIGVTGGLSRTLLRRGRCKGCPDLTVAARYELSANKVEEQGPGNVNDPGVPANIGRLVPSLSADWRDSILDPRRGAFFEARVEVARPYLTPLPDGASFVRALASGQFYLGLGTPFAIPGEDEAIFGGPIVLAVGGRLGLGWPTGAGERFPKSEAFSYGGDASVRGLRLRVTLPFWPNARTLLEGSAELRWYLLQNVGFGTVQLALFVDAASVSVDDRLGFGPATVSVGPALRYVTPVGPISLAWGKPIRVPGLLGEEVSRSGRLHLTFGYAF